MRCRQGKVLGGFLIGFGLATAIFFSIIFAILSPYSSQITVMYQTTQSGWYSSAISFLNGLKGIAGNPIISALTGGMGGNAASTIGSITDFMVNARQTISILYTLMTITIPAIVISVIMIIIGGIVASRSGQSVSTNTQTQDKKGKHCPHCGEKVSRGDKFCPDCGKKV